MKQIKQTAAVYPQIMNTALPGTFTLCGRDCGEDDGMYLLEGCPLIVAYTVVGANNPNLSHFITQSLSLFCYLLD